MDEGNESELLMIMNFIGFCIVILCVLTKACQTTGIADYYSANLHREALILHRRYNFPFSDATVACDMCHSTLTHYEGIVIPM